LQPRRIDGAESLGPSPAPSLVAIGNFDGVHRGHRTVISAAAGEARERGLSPLILTFHPHPAEVLGRGGFSMLTRIDRKIELVTRIDPALSVVVQPFTHQLSEMTPREFAADLLVGRLGARSVIVGENFRFGHGRAGDLATLIELGRELGFEARAAKLEGDLSGTYSSSRVREAIARADLATAEHVLGRPHSVSGVVVAGDRRGRSIGFPTANLGDLEELLPPDGVYACLVDREEAASATALGTAAANLGTRPTVDGSRRVLEAHLLDFEGDLYGTRLRVHFVDRLREERRFSGLDELRAQIELDTAAARRALAGRKPDPAAGGRWH
jgi:riboflavin kinase/FMN adenylyltransferase